MIDLSGLVPPPLATWGIQSFSTSWNYTTSWKGNYTFGTQLANGQIVIQFYVYLVDGNAPAPDYYVVIAVVTGFISPLIPGTGPGTGLLSNTDTFRGFMQYEGSVTLQVLQTNGTPFDPGFVPLIASTPSSWSNLQQVPFDLDVQMMLMSDNGHGGKSPQAFNATLGGFQDLTGWAVDNQTGLNQMGFYYSQAAPWTASDWLSQNNGHTQTFVSFEGQSSTFLTTAFPSGIVAALPQFSSSNFSFAAAGAWTFDPSLIENGYLQVLFNGSFYGSNLMLGTQDNTHGPGRYGAQLTNYFTPSTWNVVLDLGTVVQSAVRQPLTARMLSLGAKPK